MLGSSSALMVWLGRTLFANKTFMKKDQEQLQPYIAVYLQYREEQRTSMKILSIRSIFFSAILFNIKPGFVFFYKFAKIRICHKETNLL